MFAGTKMDASQRLRSNNAAGKGAISESSFQRNERQLERLGDVLRRERSCRQFFRGKDVEDHLRLFISSRSCNNSSAGRQARDVDHSIRRTVARVVDEDADVRRIRVLHRDADAVAFDDELAVVVGRRAVDLELQLRCSFEP